MRKTLFNVVYTALHALCNIMRLNTYSKTKEKRPTFSTLIHEDMSFIEHTAIYSLLHKTVTFHRSAGFY